MSHKKSKEIRKRTGYHPSQQKSYEVRTVETVDKSGQKYLKKIMELSSDCSRYMYKQIKKELRQT